MNFEKLFTDINPTVTNPVFIKVTPQDPSKKYKIFKMISIDNDTLTYISVSERSEKTYKDLIDKYTHYIFIKKCGAEEIKKIENITEDIPKKGVVFVTLIGTDQREVEAIVYTDPEIKYKLITKKRKEKTVKKVKFESKYTDFIIITEPPTCSSGGKRKTRRRRRNKRRTHKKV